MGSQVGVLAKPWDRDAVSKGAERRGKQAKTHLDSTPSTKRFRFQGSIKSNVMMKRRTLRLVMASEPYVDSDRICDSTSARGRVQSGNQAHLVTPDLLFMVPLQNCLHQI